MTNIWHHWPGIDEEIAAIFDPFGNAVHTALAFPVLGEDVLVSGAGPIGLMATAVVRHAGARHIVVSEPNAVPPRARDAHGRHASPSTRASATFADVFAELDMVEGFDVALEMSGNAAALRGRDRERWPTAAAIAILGLPTEEITLDINEVVFKMLTLRGIYGREMYETWYKMTVMLQSGLDIRPAITHRFGFRELRGRLRRRPSRRLRQGHHGLDDMTPPPADPTRWPSSTTSSPRSASATSTGRCGS